MKTLVETMNRNRKQAFWLRMIQARLFYMLVGIIFLTFTLWVRPAQITALWSTARIAKGFWDNFGIASSIAGGFSLLLWGVNILRSQYRKQAYANLIVLQIGLEVIKWLRKQHQFFGWIVFGLALLHAVYFLVFPRGQMMNVYTGLIAMVGLFFVVGLGIMFQYKTLPVPKVRKWHLYTGLVFAAAVAVHLLLL